MPHRIAIGSLHRLRYGLYEGTSLLVEPEREVVVLSMIGAEYYDDIQVRVKALNSKAIWIGLSDLERALYPEAA